MTEKAKELLESLVSGDVVKFDTFADVETGIYLEKAGPVVIFLDRCGIWARVKVEDILDIERVELEDISIELFAVLLVRRLREKFPEWEVIYGEEVTFGDLEADRVNVGFRTKNPWKRDFEYETEGGLTVSNSAYVSSREIIGGIKVEDRNGEGFTYEGVQEVVDILTADLEKLEI